jgi:aspartate kinase
MKEMENTVVCKFGGSSVASAAQIRKVRKIVETDPKRKVVVVSAPGKSEGDREKLTDHLINIATNGEHFHEQRKTITAEESRKSVVRRFSRIVEQLEIDGSDLLAALQRDLDKPLEGDKRTAFYASRGEHYSAAIVAKFFEKTGLPARTCLPEEIGLRVSSEHLDAKVLPGSHSDVARALGSENGIAIVPGYYGITAENDVAVMSRGGSDLTAGELAFAVDAELYENWTDTSGVYEVDPNLIHEAQVIPRLTFKEIRLLASKGFNVFHFDAMLRCKNSKIPISVRNTNRPEELGTLILNERVPEEGVVGIAKADNMAYIYLSKDGLGEEIGFVAELLTIFREHCINTHHYPTDVDDISVLICQDDLKGHINDLRRAIHKRLKPDVMEVHYNLSILTPVGLGLRGNSYPLVDALTVLGENHIPIEMMNQAPSQVCFHIGVLQAVSDVALRVLHERLLL